MNPPLLALTRGQEPAVASRSPSEVLVENMRQLVQLRWLAVAGQLVAILVAQIGLGVPLPILPMLGVVALLAIANLVFLDSLSRPGRLKEQLLPALLIDLAALTLQLYLSGGANNPFVSLYLLQVVLGAILLPTSSVWLLVAASTACFAILNFHHVPLRLPDAVWGVPVDLRLVGEWISFVLVAVLLVLFISRISRNLRTRDAYVAELRQRAVEEDGIVRMGLFASGAAHELGTPLSTLSVLLSDWRRHPVVAREPELTQEVAEALDEVERCKDIVSNILHSAGLARGEAMESMVVARMLRELAEAWQASHPAVPLEERTDELGSARIAAEPALRQAVWSLLENTAGAGATQVWLDGEVQGASVVITISDDGDGFPPDQLQRVGRLYQSSKGAGHGLGLFLASTVVRRLGGTLEAFNRDEGGAMVRLLLPLVTPRGDLLA